MRRRARSFPPPSLLLAACVVLGASGCSRGGGERPAAVPPDATPAVASFSVPGVEDDRDTAAPAEPACRLAGSLLPLSPVASHASSPSLAWGPGVLGISYIRDEGARAVARLERLLDGVPHGAAVELGEGAARAPTALAWNGSAFVIAWNEPSDLVGEVFVGMVDAAGAVSWNASRVTATLRTGAWRMPGRTAVESKDPRLLALPEGLVVSWRTHTQPEAYPLYFAAVRGLEVSAPAAVSPETAFVFDHRLATWDGRPALAYFGRFDEGRRQVRAARLSLDPPAVAREAVVAEAGEPPDLFELAAVPLGPNLGVLWRDRTEWNSTSNVRFVRLAPDTAEAEAGAPALLAGVLAARPTVNVPRRTFDAAPAGEGFAALWAFQEAPAAGGAAGLRLAPFHADGTPAGAPLRIETGDVLPRDPMLLRAGAGDEHWFVFVRGEPPATPGRVWVGRAVCSPPAP